MIKSHAHPRLPARHATADSPFHAMMNCDCEHCRRLSASRAKWGRREGTRMRFESVFQPASLPATLLEG